MGRKSWLRARKATAVATNGTEAGVARRSATPARRRFFVFSARKGRGAAGGLIVLLALACQQPNEPQTRAVSSARSNGTDTPAERASLEPLKHPLQAASAPKPPAQGAKVDKKAGILEVLASQELTWKFRTQWGPLHVVVWLPQRTTKQRFEALIALHGRGETLKGSARGARGWLDDYALLSAIRRLKSPPLVSADFGGLVTHDELSRINQRLIHSPFQELVLIMPYLPDVLKKDEAFINGPKLGRFVRDELLPRVHRELPVRPGALGIDGVSLGGRASLLIASSAPELFVSAGALQAAIDEKELTRFTQLAKAATLRNPDLKLRLLTSDEDYYRSVNRDLSAAWAAAGVPHEFRVVQGTHSYDFNRGPGAYEMLLFHQQHLTKH